MKKAVLCVDDEAIIAMSMQDQISTRFAGLCEVFTAFSAPQGLKIIDELLDKGFRLVLVISDWLMPGPKGDEFLLKVHELYPDIEAVMVTGKADQGIIEALTRHRPVKAVFYKPWIEEDLFKVIDEILKDRDAHDH